MKKDKKVYQHNFPAKRNQEMPEIESIEIGEQMLKVFFKDVRFYTETNDDGTFSHTIMPRTSDYDILESDKFESTTTTN